MPPPRTVCRSCAARDTHVSWGRCGAARYVILPARFIIFVLSLPSGNLFYSCDLFSCKHESNDSLLHSWWSKLSDSGFLVLGCFDFGLKFNLKGIDAIWILNKFCFIQVFTWFVYKRFLFTVSKWLPIFGDTRFIFEKLRMIKSELQFMIK